MSASDDRADEARAIRRRLVRRVGSLEHAANCLRGAYMPGPDLTGGERDASDALARRFKNGGCEHGSRSAGIVAAFVTSVPDCKQSPNGDKTWNSTKNLTRRAWPARYRS